MIRIKKESLCLTKIVFVIGITLSTPCMAKDNGSSFLNEQNNISLESIFTADDPVYLSQSDVSNERPRRRRSVRRPGKTENELVVPAEKETKDIETTIQPREQFVNKPAQKTKKLTSPKPTSLKPTSKEKQQNIAIKRGPLPAPNFESMGEPVIVPSRWKIVDALGYPSNILDPYNTNNPLKGDEPVLGEDWFINLGLISNTFIESRYVTTPLANATTRLNNQIDLIGDGQQMFMNQNLEFEVVLYKGDTVFRPPDFEFRFIPVLNYNRIALEEKGLVNIDPTRGNNNGTVRTDNFLGIQTLFVDFHLRDASSRYDFDSIRLGIQPFTSDFRGFLFQDQPLGIRLFGIRNNNILQYNLAWFRRIEKDTNSGLNDIGQRLRDDDIFVANLYWQDLPTLGYTSQFTLLYNRNREKNLIQYDNNGFIARPSSFLSERGKNYDIAYLGYNSDGHFGRLNLTTSFYYALGKQTNLFTPNTENSVNALFGAIETSIDVDWMRFKLSALYSSGDEDPFDDKDTGFDAIFENPQFAGADSSYYIRQSIPLIGGGGVALSGRNGILNSLRSSKELGQSNFINPGLMLVGVGADLDILPELRIAFNANQLWFQNTETLSVLRQQGTVAKPIGVDLSMSLTYRPLLSQNIVMRLVGATLIPEQGYKDLYGNDNTLYSAFANLVLTY